MIVKQGAASMGELCLSASDAIGQGLRANLRACQRGWLSLSPWDLAVALWPFWEACRGIAPPLMPVLHREACCQLTSGCAFCHVGLRERFASLPVYTRATRGRLGFAVAVSGSPVRMSYPLRASHWLAPSPSERWKALCGLGLDTGLGRGAKREDRMSGPYRATASQ